MGLELNVDQWAAAQFGDCQLGDVRRTRRAVKMAAQFAAHPSGSTPEQTETWADCKAAYRLFDNPHVSFTALATPHWEQTKAQVQPGGHYLLLGDTTFITFDQDRQIEGMGILTSGKGKGYLLHSALMLDAQNLEVLGLAGQTIHYRKRLKAAEKGRARLKRPRESEIWGNVIQQIGPPPEKVRFTHVFDRGADNYENFCQLLMQRGDWIIRAAQARRRVLVGGVSAQLQQHLAAQPVAGTYQLTVSANEKQPARQTEVEVRFCTVGVPRTNDASAFVKECGIHLIMMNAVEVRETHPPRGAKGLRWILLTSHAVQNFNDAWQVIHYYEQRPRIEEFHKALKTGCRLEERLYEKAHRWEAVTALLSVVAVRLLQLKSIALREPDRPAEEVVPAKMIKMLSRVRTGRQRAIHTVRDFMRALAGLGGHLGRKSDGEPGWITLWRGYNKLHLLLRGAAAMNKSCG